MSAIRSKVLGADVTARRFRVLQLIETGGPGGAEVCVARIGSALERRGIESPIWLLKSGWLEQELVRRGLQVSIVEEPRLLNPCSLIRWIRRVRAAEIDAIHSHEFLMNCVGSIIAKILGIPHVASVHGCNYYADRWYRRLAYRLVSRLSHLVAVSSNTSQFVQRELNIPEGRIKTIVNGLDVDGYVQSPDLRAATRRQLGLDAEELMIISVGSLYPIKGHRDLLPAIRGLKVRGYPVRLFLVGVGGERAALEREVEKLDIASSVRFLGHRSDVASLLQAADLFVMPSLNEGMPLALLEAMASGCPVVATAVGGIPELVERGVSGVLVAPQAPGELEDAIARMCDGPVERRSMALAARERVASSFSLDGMMERYIALYRPMNRS